MIGTAIENFLACDQSKKASDVTEADGPSASPPQSDGVVVTESDESRSEDEGSEDTRSSSSTPEGGILKDAAERQEKAEEKQKHKDKKPKKVKKKKKGKHKKKDGQSSPGEKKSRKSKKAKGKQKIQDDDTKPSWLKQKILCILVPADASELKRKATPLVPPKIDKPAPEEEPVKEEPPQPLPNEEDIQKIYEMLKEEEYRAELAQIIRGHLRKQASLLYTMSLLSH